MVTTAELQKALLIYSQVSLPISVRSVANRIILNFVLQPDDWTLRNRKFGGSCDSSAHATFCQIFSPPPLTGIKICSRLPSQCQGLSYKKQKIIPLDARAYHLPRPFCMVWSIRLQQPVCERSGIVVNDRFPAKGLQNAFKTFIVHVSRTATV